MTASPNQFTPRTRMRSAAAWGGIGSISSTKTDLADALVEVPRPGQDFDLHPHEIDGEIAPVDPREANGVFLGGDNHLGLLLLASINGVQNLLLGEAMMVGETLAVNQLGALPGQAFFETFRLRDAAEGSDPSPLNQREFMAFAGEN